MDLHNANNPVIQKLIEEKYLFVRDDCVFCTHDFEETGMEKFDVIRNMASSEHAVIIVGLPKTGSHLALSLVDELGVERAEELGIEDGISPMPFEYHKNLNSYTRMEKKMQEAKSLILLPHCHLYPQFFPKNFKGKIIHMSRDPRAVAASAYPFIQKLPFYKCYMDAWGFKNIDEYAKHDAEGLSFWGSIKSYDGAWREAANTTDMNIIFMTFEELIRDKPGEITRLANFLGITNVNIPEVIENISIKNAMERRKKKWDDAGLPFREIVCYRKGKSKAWRDELSNETKALFKKVYPELED